MNCLYKCKYYTIFFYKGFERLNRMLTIYFSLRIDWNTYKGQIRSTANKRIDVSLRSAAQWDSIGSVHKLIFNNQSTAQRDRIVL